jgi:hypothetical protein
MVYRIYFTNHGYYHEQVYNTVQEAIAKGKQIGFEFSVRSASKSEPGRIFNLICAWSPLYGLRDYTLQRDQ